MMSISPRAAVRATLLAGATMALAAGALGAPASASPDPGVVSVECVDDHDDGSVASSAKGGTGRGLDTREVSATEAEAINAQMRRQIKKSGSTPSAAAQRGGSIPVYVHVMASASGAGDVTNSQVNQQIAVLNKTYGGQESGQAAETGFTFTLAGVDRFYNNTWHGDGSSRAYRSQTRQGGADALNIWLVDFSYLGVATFPWDYSSDPSVDGIRVQYSSLPGGSATNYNYGETTTHEAGHWLGLYHTFQGGCTTDNDYVSDTPAQGGPSSGCPEGADTCSLPGSDPVHNYMDYSYDLCYDQFTTGQSSRMSQAFAAYRA